MSGPTKKQRLQAECAARGIRYAQRDTIADLEAKLTGKSSGGRAAPARSAALVKSAPTVRLRVDGHTPKPEPRRPGSADILAVALVVFLSVLAAMGTTLEKERGTHSPAPATVTVAHA